MENIAGYSRVSGKSKTEVSLTDQADSIKGYAEKNGYKIFRIYQDAGVSGARTDRPALLELKRDAELGKFSKLVFSRLDRFGRNLRDALNNFEYFESRKIELVSLKENLDTSTNEGKLQRNLLSAISEWERVRIRERILTGLNARAEKGLKVGQIPYALKWNEAKGLIETVPEEVKIYEKMVDMFLVQKISMQKIGAILSREGIKTRRGKNWLQCSIGNLLKNPIFKGRYDYTFQGKEYSIGSPKLIDSTRWNMIQKGIEGFHSRPKNYKDDSYLLQGLLVCGECGYNITPARCNRKPRADGEKARYYGCYLATARKMVRDTLNVNKSCGLPYINAYEIEDEVLGEIFKHFQFPENLVKHWKNQFEEIGDKQTLESKIKSDKIRVGKLRSRAKGLFNEYIHDEEDKVDLSSLKENQSEIKNEIQRLEETITENEKKLEMVNSKKVELDSLSEVSGEIKNLWPAISKAFVNLTDEQKKGLIQTCLDGRKLSVRLLRQQDIVDNPKGMSKDFLYQTIDKKYRGGLTKEWIIEGVWNFNIAKASKYLQPLIKLNKVKLKILMGRSS